MRAVWVLVLMGCPSGDTDPVEADTDTDTDTDADTDTDTDTDTDVGPVTQVAGVVTDGAGTSVVGAAIRFCRGAICLTAETNADGVFELVDVQAEPHSFEVVPVEGSGLITGFTVVELVADVPKSIAMGLPVRSAPSPLGPSPAWLAAGVGLRVQAASTDLETPPFLPDATELVGARVPTERWPTMDGLTDVKAVWFLEPFDYPAPGGLPVEFDNDFGANDGEIYQVMVGSYEASAWVEAGTVTANGALLTGSAELPLVSTVVLVGPVAVP
jgi:hypothetical protein